MAMRDFRKRRLTDECVRDWPQFENEFNQEAATKLFNIAQNGPVPEAILEKSIKEEEVATKNKERRQELEAIAAYQDALRKLHTQRGPAPADEDSQKPGKGGGRGGTKKGEHRGGDGQ